MKVEHFSAASSLPQTKIITMVSSSSMTMTQYYLIVLLVYLIAHLRLQNLVYRTGWNQPLLPKSELVAQEQKKRIKKSGIKGLINLLHSIVPANTPFPKYRLLKSVLEIIFLSLVNSEFFIIKPQR